MKLEENFNLKGKVALITGASKGIGEAIAWVYGKAGAKVIISSRKEEALLPIVAQMKEEGIKAAAIVCNVGDTAQIDRLVAEAENIFGGIDILVNNAATNPVFGPIAETELRTFDKIIDVNLKGPFYLSQKVTRSMKQRGGGSIINISSVEGVNPGYGLGIYSVSKAGLVMLTKVMAKEWGMDNIRVNAICSGLIKTKFSKSLWSNEQILEGVMAKQPLKSLGKPEDITGIALLLASDAGRYCTGSVITADGGLTI
ncbi:glucose 1-dehydrogenase [Rapidithrix thailandica]|uniref:Glucose 1-dehydrogenase n=1 Tax=Rapidithrix thailandica TaxID=413964 RepID=A0AAW9S8D8_9BACT